LADEKAEATLYAVEIPKLSSLILTHSWDGEVKGLKDGPGRSGRLLRGCSGAFG